MEHYTSNMSAAKYTSIKPSYKLATKAIHKLGDISRDEGDLCVVYGETETDYVGNWTTGLGFFDVHFPKDTVRDLTHEEEIRFGLVLPDNPPVTILNNWSIVGVNDPYKAPELQVFRLHGVVTGHPRLEDGEVITTTRLRGKRNGYVATRNTLYQVGDVDPAYEKEFPGAKERLFASLEEI